MSHYVHNSRIRKIEGGGMPPPVVRKGTTSSSERKDALKKRVSLPRVGAPCTHKHWNPVKHGRHCDCGALMYDPGD